MLVLTFWFGFAADETSPDESDEVGVAYGNQRREFMTSFQQ
jgi:hypothetical protein